MPEMTEQEILADMEAFAKEPIKVGPGKFVHPEPTFQESAKEAVAKQEAEKPVEKAEETEQKAETDVEKAEQPAEGRSRDDKGRFVAKDAGPTDTKAVVDTDSPERLADAKSVQPEPTDTQPVTDYEKAKKERERQKGVLAGFEEEKKREREKIRIEREQIAAERERLRQESLRERPSDVIGYDHLGKEVYSSASLWKAAQDFERNGQDDLAKVARDAIPNSQRLEAQQAQQLFESARNRMISHVVGENPAFGDSTSPEYAEMSQIYNEEVDRARNQGRRPLFEIIPDFMPIAADVVKLRRKVADHEEVVKQLTAAQAEIKRLNSKLTVNGSSPTSAPKEREFQQATTDEQLAALDVAMAAAKKQMYR